MGVSYELSRREGRIGGPEKPLSDLGRRGYLKFWEARVATALLSMRNKTSISVEDVAQQCWMVVDDTILALKEMGLLETRKRGAGVVLAKNKVRDWAKSRSVLLIPPVDEDCFMEEWMPERKDEKEL